MFRIHTQYQRAYPWIQCGNIHFIGYLNTPNYHIPDAKEISAIFSPCHELSKLKKCLSTLNGVFSIIIKNENEVLIASDTTRFFPVFYTQTGNDWMISDSIQYLKKHKPQVSLDPYATLEFLSAAYTLRGSTLYSGIKQVQPGSVVSISHGYVDSSFFYSFAKTQNDYSTGTFHEQQQALRAIIDTSFQRCLTPIRDQQIVLPLSGGYDSRLIACKLKELGCKNVVCFTYGRNNREVQISKSVAKQLHFPWHFIEYTTKVSTNALSLSDFSNYAEYASRGTSMFYLQEFPAVVELLKKGVISPGSYVIPGHSGDLIRGSLLIKSFPTTCEKEQLPNILLHTRFQHHKTSRTEKKRLLATLYKQIEQQYESEILPYSLLEDWEMKERTAKYIFNSSHVFDYFGIKPVFPLWDFELVNFFKYVPLEYRTYGSLYMKTLESIYFQAYDVNMEQDYQPSTRAIQISATKAKIRPYLPEAIKQKLLQKNDQFAYLPMTQLLKKEMKDANYKYSGNSNSVLHGILNWYLYKLENELHDKQNK